MTDTAKSTDELSAEVRAAVGTTYRRFRSARPAGALGDAAMAVLAYLRKAGPQTLKALSDRDRVTPGSMSQTVNRLEAAGYLVRTPDPSDGRRVLFTATESGLAVATDAHNVAVEWFDSGLAQLTADERETLARASRILLRLAAS